MISMRVQEQYARRAENWRRHSLRATESPNRLQATTTEISLEQRTRAACMSPLQPQLHSPCLSPYVIFATNQTSRLSSTPVVELAQRSGSC